MDNVIIAAQQAVVSYHNNYGCQCMDCQSDRTLEDDNVFTSSGFSKCLMKIAGLNGGIDGALIRAILIGRNDIQEVGKGYYRLLYNRPDLKLQLLLE